MLYTRLLTKLIPLALLAATVVIAQDKITITVQRGTLTKTAVIDAAPASEAMKAMDYLVATACSSPTACEYKNETDAIRKHLVSWFLQQLTVTPGTAIKTAADTASAAQKALDKAMADYSTAAQVLPVQ